MFSTKGENMNKRTVFGMLQKAADKYKGKAYLSEKDDKGWLRFSFDEVYSKSQILASALIDLGIQKESKIALLSEAKNFWVISEFATLMAGGISVPLSIKLTAEELPLRINHSDADFFIISENTIEKVISQWGKYESKELKLIVLDQPSDKIAKLCEKYNFDINQLLFIEDLMQKGQASFEKNKDTIAQIITNTKEDDVVTISYTSGTTGNTKGIMLTHLNYYANAQDADTIFRIKEFISTLIILPTDHSFAHTVGIYTALRKGISLHFVDARGGGMNALKNIPKNLIEAKSNFLLTVPALTSNFINKMKDGIKAKGTFIEGIFNRGLEAAIRRNGDAWEKISIWTKIKTYPSYIIAEKLIFSKLRNIFGANIEFLVGGGALLDIKQQQFFKAIGVPVYQGYGLTEAAPIISSNTPFLHKMGTSGRVLPSVECKICDENGKELSKGEKGEIVIRGDNVMKGYYKNPEETAKVIKDNWLYTGDLGYIDEDDFLIVVGREKALLISDDGEKYSPEEIEEAITNSSSIIKQTMIYNDHKKFTSALITIDNQKLKDFVNTNKIQKEEDILNLLKKELHAFKQQKEFKNRFPEKWIPSTFQIISEEFSEENKMINSTLKMVRHKITEAYQERIDNMYQNPDIAKQNNIQAIQSILKS